MNSEEQSKFFSYIDENKQRYIDELAAWVAIPSVSAHASYREHVFLQMDVAKEQFEKVGCQMRMVQNPLDKQVFPDGQEKDYPPVLLGTYPKEHDPSKKTILIYGHLDVQPALKSDGWDTDPFVMTVKDGKMFGRGSTDDKGPVMGWLIVIRAFQDLGIELGVNLRLCFEGMEECGSLGLEELIFNETKLDGDKIIDERAFFSTGIDGTCISDNYWLGTKKPCLTYGLRGNVYFAIEVTCADRDLHSGVFGGTCHEAMTDLFHICSSMVGSDGKITIEGIYDQVQELTQKELDMYTGIDFDLKDYEQGSGIKLLNGGYTAEAKINTLMGRWRYPTCTISGVEGAYYEPGGKTVIPAKVLGKVTMRIVPDMTPERTIEVVTAHVTKVVEQLGTQNDIKLHVLRTSKPWHSSPDGFLFQSAIKATKDVYGVMPDMTREGGSIPVTLSFEQASKSPVILLPMGAGDDGAHGQNEKLNIRNYIGGIKLMGAFLQGL